MEFNKEYKEGWKSFIENLFADCPYESGSEESIAWHNGWFDCEENNLFGD